MTDSDQLSVYISTASGEKKTAIMNSNIRYRDDYISDLKTFLQKSRLKILQKIKKKEDNRD